MSVLSPVKHGLTIQPLVIDACHSNGHRETNGVSFRVPHSGRNASDCTMPMAVTRPLSLSPLKSQRHIFCSWTHTIDVEPAVASLDIHLSNLCYFNRPNHKHGFWLQKSQKPKAQGVIEGADIHVAQQRWADRHWHSSRLTLATATRGTAAYRRRGSRWKICFQG